MGEANPHQRMPVAVAVVRAPSPHREGVRITKQAATTISVTYSRSPRIVDQALGRDRQTPLHQEQVSG